MYSGTKLVLLIVGVALTAGGLSWWYRYEAAHRATRFWGPEAAALIAQPSEVRGFAIQNETPRQLGIGQSPVLTKTPGMVHLRNALLSDRNYHWDDEPVAGNWRWCLQFADEGCTATVLFAADFTRLGLQREPGGTIRTANCQPMAITLRDYFRSAGIFVDDHHE